MFPGALQSCMPMPELRGWAVLQALRDLEEGEEAKMLLLLVLFPGFRNKAGTSIQILKGGWLTGVACVTGHVRRDGKLHAMLPGDDRIRGSWALIVSASIT